MYSIAVAMLPKVVFIVIFCYHLSIWAHFARLHKRLTDIGTRGLPIMHFLVHWVINKTYSWRN